MVEVVGIDLTKLKRISCSGCASILQYQENEVKDYETSSMGDSGRKWYIDCPKCGKEVTIRSI